MPAVRQPLDVPIQCIAQGFDKSLGAFWQVGILHKSGGKFQQRDHGGGSRTPDEQLPRGRIHQKAGQTGSVPHERVVNGKADNLRKQRPQKRCRQRRADTQRKSGRRRLQMMQQQLCFFSRALFRCFFFHHFLLLAAFGCILAALRATPSSSRQETLFPAQLVDISKLGLNSKTKTFSYSFICRKRYSPPFGGGE